MSFDVMQGYLQMPAEEADIQKMHLGLDCLAYKSLLICYSYCAIQGPVSVTSWRCV